ncbi:MAG: TIGR04376 family protein, partial [Cyanobacteriota bacterium]
MSLLDDLTKFLETRLDEFLKNNPHLELQALEEQLREEEK